MYISVSDAYPTRFYCFTHGLDRSLKVMMWTKWSVAVIYCPVSLLKSI